VDATLHEQTGIVTGRNAESVGRRGSFPAEAGPKTYQEFPAGKAARFARERFIGIKSFRLLVIGWKSKPPNQGAEPNYLVLKGQLNQKLSPAYAKKALLTGITGQDGSYLTEIPARERL